MIALARPDVRFHRTYQVAGAEFLAQGHPELTEVVQPADATFGGRSWTHERLDDPAEFARMCADRIADADPASPRPAGWVPCSYRWVVEDDTEYLGTISLRHELTPGLLEVGGHIGYSVRPTARRRGVATEALRLMLPVAAAYGIDPVLVTCDDDNIGSLRAIEHNGGVLEDIRGVKRRYWVPTKGP